MLSEREARFRTRTLGWGSLVAVVASLWVFGVTSKTFYLVALIPWIAALVYRTGHGAIFLLVGHGDPRPNLALVYNFGTIWPGIVALGNETRPLRWELLVIIGFGIGSLLAAVALKNRPTRAELLLLIASNSFYGFGMAAAINQDLDSDIPQTYRAQVLAKRIVRFRRGDYYYLNLAPVRGLRLLPAEVMVKWRVYDRSPVGETVCVLLHPGGLHVPWFETRPCLK